MSSSGLTIHSAAECITLAGRDETDISLRHRREGRLQAGHDVGLETLLAPPNSWPRNWGRVASDQECGTCDTKIGPWAYSCKSVRQLPQNRFRRTAAQRKTGKP
jgi:hypothetical protein